MPITHCSLYRTARYTYRRLLLFLYPSVIGFSRILKGARLRTLYVIDFLFEDVVRTRIGSGTSRRSSAYNLLGRVVNFS